MEEKLLAILLGNPAVALHFGLNVYWVAVPQKEKTKPNCVLQVVGNQQNYSFSGQSNLTRTRVQIDVRAKTYLASKAAARAVSKALSGYRSGAIKGIFLDTARDLPDTDAGDVNQLFRVSIDIFIYHQESSNG
ncbi:DUF3168 domain-containing protein [Rhizobium sp. RM]|uniref:tail completion protein gp17 n=1 Tax=Rhizobium sp. RM TaxID=2748079 RepID=UPI00110F03A3|nr:DUF3168 domain-containing protein [Rhizobium sp. RM]NWJ24769.1 DUF3168 domain-containing protein [Rhizobium sp. RM]TMV16568.1 DUF3168 domain-containing protein [Rhizobium sp. Td3]